MAALYSERLALLSEDPHAEKHICPDFVRENKGFVILCCTAFSILTLGIIFIVIRVPEIEPNIKTDIFLSELVMNDAENQALERVYIKLDLSPEERWLQLGRRFRDRAVFITRTASMLRNSTSYSYLTEQSSSPEVIVSRHDPSLLVEIQSYAKALNVSREDLIIFNLLYIHNMHCSTALVHDHAGRVWQRLYLAHEYPALMRPLALEIDFMKYGQVVFRGVTAVGLVGIPAGVRPNGFTLSLHVLQEIEDQPACRGRKKSMVSLFTVRKVLSDVDSYDRADRLLKISNVDSGHRLVLGGTRPGESVVLTSPCLSPSYTSLLNITNVETFYTIMMSARYPSRFEALCWTLNWKKHHVLSNTNTLHQAVRGLA